MAAIHHEHMLDAGGCPLRITVAESGTTITLDLAGEWDLAAQSAARNAISLVLERHPKRVVLDLSRLSFIDSSGLHNVLELHGRCAQQDTQLVIIPGSRAVQQAFEICQLTERLPFLEAAA